MYLIAAVTVSSAPAEILCCSVSGQFAPASVPSCNTPKLNC